MIQTTTFSLFSTTPRTTGEFWLPVARKVNTDGLLLTDLEPIARRCDPCTATALRRLFVWTDKKILSAELNIIRNEVLPGWKCHLDLAMLFGQALLRQQEPSQFIATASSIQSTGIIDTESTQEENRGTVCLNNVPEHLPYFTDSWSNQVIAAASIIRHVQVGGIIGLERFNASPELSSFSFICEALLQCLDDRPTLNQILSQYRQTRLRQMDEAFRMLGWVLELLRFSAPLSMFDITLKLKLSALCCDDLIPEFWGSS